jgi:hypothetical protein
MCEAWIFQISPHTCSDCPCALLMVIVKLMALRSLFLAANIARSLMNFIILHDIWENFLNQFVSGIWIHRMPFSHSQYPTIVLRNVQQIHNVVVVHAYWFSKSISERDTIKLMILDMH